MIMEIPVEHTETIVREDRSIYAVVDYIADLQLRLQIIKGEIEQPLYYLNEHGGVDRINEYGTCDHHRPFVKVNKLLREIIHAQMNKRLNVRS